MNLVLSQKMNYAAGDVFKISNRQGIYLIVTDGDQVETMTPCSVVELTTGTILARSTSTRLAVNQIMPEGEHIINLGSITGLKE